MATQSVYSYAGRQGAMFRRSIKPDNSVDDAVLELLKPAAASARPRCFSLVFGALIVLERLLAISWFLLSFVVLKGCKSVSVYALLPLLAVVGLFSWPLIGVSGLIVSGLLFVLTPVLRELTLTYDEDAIWMWSIAALVVHVVFYSYHSSNHDRLVPGGALSLNASMFAAAVMASRLPTEVHVLTLLATSMLLNMLLPVGIAEMRAGAAGAYVVLLITGAIATCAITWLFLRSGLAAISMASLFGFITLIAPALFWALHPLKQLRPGPWDIAHVSPQHRDAS